MIKLIIQKNLALVLKKMGVVKNPKVEAPTNADFGDYSTSIALKLTKTLKKNPLQIAEEIVKNLPKDDLIEKIEVIKPGFINFWISKKNSINQLIEFSQGKFTFPTYYFGPEKKVIVEFAHPNTHKLFHIGHLRNISTGESIVRILEAVGNKVIRTNYQGDVGLHIAHCLWKIKKLLDKDKTVFDKMDLREKIRFLGKAYSEANTLAENNKDIKKEILDINEKIYKKGPEIIELWNETRKWSIEYFEEIYKRVDSHFDRCYFESEMAEHGVEICKNAQKKGILEKSEGALVFNGKKFGLDIRVFINSLGFPTYEGKELALAEKEFSDFGNIDKCIHVVTPEQTSFFKVTFKVEELLDEKKYKNKQYHLIYEWVKLKTGKMASRLGNVIEGEWLIDEAKKRISKKFKLDDQTAETLAVASVKYSFLKSSVKEQIHFDFDESISLEGNSGPYLLYTYVRCQSVLKKIKINSLTRELVNLPKINNDELILLRFFTKYQETVLNATEQLSPHIICTYLFELAQKFNLFYQKCPILKADEETKNFRLLLTQATAQVIKNGLYLLGIRTVNKM